jgi:hypothetical protein
MVDGRTRSGKATAAKMTPEERIARAKAGVAAKLQRAKLPKATHSGVITLGDIQVACFVLDDGRRVVSGRGLTSAIGMKGRGQGASRISAHKLVRNSAHDLTSAIENPVKFVGKSPKGDNVPSDGYEAVVLQEVCEAILSARDKGLLVTEQDHRYAKHADILIRGFARVGIIALVDEATGYQKDRERNALAKILEAFVAKEIQPWVKTFSSDFYENLFRLRGLTYPPTQANWRPGYFGHLTNDIVYSRIAPGVLSELKAQAVKDEKRAKLHQRLTAEIGHPKLREHIASATTVMKLSKNYDDFIQKMDVVHPRFNDTPRLDFDADES